MSERERRLLDVIERGLAAGDPELARRLRRPPRSTRWWSRPEVPAAVGVVLAIALVWLGLVGQAFVVLAVLGAPWAWHAFWTRREGRAPTAPGPTTDRRTS